MSLKRFYAGNLWPKTVQTSGLLVLYRCPGAADTCTEPHTHIQIMGVFLKIMWIKPLLPFLLKLSSSSCSKLVADLRPVLCVWTAKEAAEKLHPFAVVDLTHTYMKGGASKATTPTVTTLRNCTQTSLTEAKKTLRLKNCLEIRAAG